MFLVLSCSCLCPIHWSQMLSGEWRCRRSSTNRCCSNYIWVINNFIGYKDATCIRGLTIVLDIVVFFLSGISSIMLWKCYDVLLLSLNIYSTNYNDLSNQCWLIVNWTPGNKFQWKFYQNTMVFFQQNAFENVVCIMMAILFRPQCVNRRWSDKNIFGVCWVHLANLSLHCRL